MRTRRRKKKIAVGQNWIVRSHNAHVRLYWTVQIVAKLKNGSWDYLYVAKKYSVSPGHADLLLFDEYGEWKTDETDEFIAELRFYLSGRSASKMSWLDRG